MLNGVPGLEQAIDKLQLARDRAEAALAGADVPAYQHQVSHLPEEEHRVQEHFLQGLSSLLPDECQPVPVLDPWPSLNEAAYHGLSGELIRLFRPHTESDPVALLASFLSEVGATLNRGPHLILDGTFHPLLFWPVLVGRSSKSRKGTAGKRIEQLLRLADPFWNRGECKGIVSPWGMSRFTTE
jgi:hypothetical protein